MKRNLILLTFASLALVGCGVAPGATMVPNQPAPSAPLTASTTVQSGTTFTLKKGESAKVVNGAIAGDITYLVKNAGPVSGSANIELMITEQATRYGSPIGDVITDTVTIGPDQLTATFHALTLQATAPPSADGAVTLNSQIAQY